MSFFFTQVGNDTDHWSAFTEGFGGIRHGIDAFEVPSFVNHLKQEGIDPILH